DLGESELVDLLDEKILEVLARHADDALLGGAVKAMRKGDVRLEAIATEGIPTAVVWHAELVKHHAEVFPSGTSSSAYATHRNPGRLCAGPPSCRPPAERSGDLDVVGYPLTSAGSPPPTR